MDARAVNEVNSAAGGVWPLSWTTRWDRPMHVNVQNVVRTFGVTPALHGVSLEIEPGELVALLVLLAPARRHCFASSPVSIFRPRGV